MSIWDHTFGKLSKEAQEGVRVENALHELQQLSNNSEAFQLVAAKMLTLCHDLMILHSDAASYRMLDVVIQQNPSLAKLERVEVVRLILDSAANEQFLRYITNGQVDRITRMSNPDGWCITMKGQPIVWHFGVTLCEALRLTHEATKS